METCCGGILPCSVCSQSGVVPYVAIKRNHSLLGGGRVAAGQA